jgi:hypothetical protein
VTPEAGSVEERPVYPDTLNASSATRKRICRACSSSLSTILDQTARFSSWYRAVPRKTQ